MQHILVLPAEFSEDLVLQIADFYAVVSLDKGAFLAVKIYAESRAFEAMRIAALAFPGDGFVAEIKTGDVDVGSLLIVVEMITTAAARDTMRKMNAQSPAGEVEGMNAIIAEFTGAPMPEMMPVVVEDVVLVRAFGSGALPERIIDPLGNRRGFSSADCAAPIRVPAAGEKDFADFTVADGFDSFNDPGPAS